MKNERETRKLLLESARKEFMEKGYMQASLRNICKNAGATTGALYFFFQDKEDLFAALVEEPISQLFEVMQKHYQEETTRTNENPGNLIMESDDLETAVSIVHYMYQNYEAFLLVLTKSQGSRFEGLIDRFVEITQAHYRALADQYTSMLKKPPVEEYMIHWISHMHIDIFVHMLTHEPSEAVAVRNMKSIVQYLVYGWVGMFQ